MDPISKAFVASIGRFAADQRVPVVEFPKGSVRRTWRTSAWPLSRPPAVSRGFACFGLPLGCPRGTRLPGGSATKRRIGFSGDCTRALGQAVPARFLPEDP
jgi:hypothetical protein